MKQVDLATELGLGQASTGAIVDALQRRGLIERRPDPGDRRVWLVAATEPAGAVVQQIKAIDAVFGRDLRRGLSAAEVKGLTHTSDEILANLRTMSSDYDAARREPKKSPSWI
jgi:DNA-binding MarR family transcriptional regulator